MPKISVIIPVYNVEKYLEQCLDSIISQTLDDIEIICVDDGSTDNSLEILNRYASKDSRFIVITQNNQFAAAARNNGLKIATGDYILFLDSDDFFETTLCEILYNTAISNNADVTICNANIFDSEKMTYDDVSWLLNTNYLNDKVKFNKNSLPDSLFSITSGAPWNKLFSHSFIKEQRLEFPILGSIEDVPFVFTALAAAETIIVVDERLIHYRRKANDEGLVKKIDLFPERIFEAYALLKSFLQERELFSSVEKAFVNKAASDFVDQYLYVIKNQHVKEYFKLYLAKKASYDFDLRNKPANYFVNKSIYNELQKLFLVKKTIKIVEPAISVIVPVYNTEPFLYQCLNSLLNQTFQNFELICVDDGSTDNSVAILEKYQLIDSRVKILKQQNKHAGVARNNGIQHANGKYLLFLDSDDFFEPTLLEDLYNNAEKYDSDIVLCDGYYYDNKTDTYTDAKYLLQRYNIPEKQPFSYVDNPDKILHISIDCPWNKLFKKEFIQKHELQFMALRSANDMYFVDAALMLADKISVVDKKLVNYRTNVKDSLQATRSIEPLNFYEALNEIKARMEKEDRYLAIRKSLISLFITGCRYHLDNSKNKEEYELLYKHYLETAFPKWDINLSNKEDYVFSNDYDWVKLILENSSEQYYTILQSKKRTNQINNLFSIKKDIPHVVVSLTSYPARISTVHKTIESILQQTFQPDVIVLWLADSQFPEKEKDLPVELLDLLSDKFVVRWTKDIKSYKKLIPAICEYPESIIITIDDDLIFDCKMIEGLILGYLEKPNSIQCHRITTVKYWSIDNIEIIPNAELVYEQPTYLHKLSGGAGCLYPPKSLHPDVMREDLFMNLAPTSDDIWFWMMGVLNSYKVNVVPNNNPKLKYIPGTQEVGLFKINDHGEKLFFVHLKNILRYYPVLQDIMKFEYEKYNNTTTKIVTTNLNQMQKNYYEDELNKYKNLNDSLRSSWSFRIGRFITWIPRKIRGGIRCYKEHGFRYTMNRILVHLHIVKETSKIQQNNSAIFDLTNLIRGAKKCFKDHGFKYTFKRILVHLHLIQEKQHNVVQNVVNVEVKTTAELPQEVKKDYNFYKNLDPEYYPKELKLWYERMTKKDLDLDNPKSFNEKIQWLKLYDSTPLKTRLADKYLVREWVAKIIGEEYLIPLLGVYDSYNEIEFEKLPKQFVLKANHGSGWNIIVKDKNSLDYEVAKSKFDVWMKKNFAFVNGLELHYKDISPKILVEKYMADLEGDIFDYRFFCFNGEPKYVWVDIGSGTTNHRRNIYDLNWNLQDYEVSYPKISPLPEKPDTFEQMKKLAALLCTDFSFVRVDFYSVEGKIYFGEMTFTPQSGAGVWEKDEINYMYGQLIKIPPRSEIAKLYCK